MTQIRTVICITLLMFVATSAQAATVSDLLPTTNTAALTGATFHALKSTPDGRPALIFSKKTADGSKLMYWEREAGGQWREEEIPGAGYYSGYGTGFHNEYIAGWAGLFFTPSGTPLVMIDNGMIFVRANGAWGKLPPSPSGIWPDFTNQGTAAMGPDGSLHTLSTGGYYANGTPIYGYMSLTDKTWQSTTLEVPADENYFVWSFEPRFFSMVVDANNKVHAVYVPDFSDIPVAGGTNVHSELWYLTNKNGTWETSKIYAPPPGGYGDAGFGASIALRPDGQPAVASVYISRVATGSSSSARLLLHERGSNGVWTSSTVAGSPDGYVAGDGAQGTGFAPHLLYDTLGRPHIAFTDFASQHFGTGQDAFGGNLRHAWRDGTTWRFKTVFRQTDPIRNQLFWPNMALFGASVAILGEISHDNLSTPDLFITSRDVGLVFTEFIPTGLPVTTVTAVRSGTGRGRVTSAPAGIACIDTCTGSFVTGSSVTLSATADPGSSFAGWTGCNATSGNTCTVSATAARSVTANYLDVAPPEIKISSPRGNSAQKSGNITFTANEPATFQCRLDNGTTVACTSPYPYNNLSLGQHTFTITATDAANHTSTVQHGWTVVPALIVQDFDDSGSGTKLPDGWQSIADGAFWAPSEIDNPFEISSHSGSYHLDFNTSYSVFGASAALVSPAFSLSGITGAKVKFWMYRDSARASYMDRVDVYVNSTPNLTGSPTLLGTIYRSAAFDPAVAAEGWHEYTFDLPGSSATNYLLFDGTFLYGPNIHLDDISVAYSAPQTLTVSLPGSGSGTVTSTAGVTPQLSCASPKTGCSASVEFGESVTLWATTTVGSTFSGWAGACAGVPCTFTMDGNKTAAATFNKLKYLKNETTGAYFGTLQAALGEARTGETVRALAIQMLDTGITFNTGLTPILFRGGYANLADAAPSGYTTLDGPFRISDGTLKVDRLKIK